MTVIDGDTIDATNPDGTRDRVRLLGINAPEADQCGGADATAHLAHLLAGRDSILIVRDDSQPERDRYGRVLAYVDLDDGNDIGAVMIRDGYATELTIDEAHDRAAAYVAAQGQARTAARGAWAACPIW